MARRSQTPALTGATYRQFAALVLVGALGVALFGGSDGVAEPAAAPPAPDAMPAPAPRPESEDSGSEFFAAEAEADDFAAEETTASQDGEPASDQTADISGSPAPEAPAARPADTGPTPVQIARLVEASRERSGARPGGD